MLNRITSCRVVSMLMLAIPAAVLAADPPALPAPLTPPLVASPPVGPSPQAGQFNGTAFSDCIQYLQDASGINFNVDWKSLEAAGIARDTPVTLRVGPGISLGRTLKMILQQAGGAGGLTSYVEAGIVNITTQAAEDKLMVTRMYRIQDLLFQPTDYTGAPSLDLGNVQNQSAGGGGGGGGASQSQIFSGNNTNRQNDKISTATDRANGIIKLITDSIRPEIWTVNGGAGTIEFFNGSLFVRAPRSVQRQISSQYQQVATSN